ncbi:hypothetical protein P280DRAFT_485372 [Massarina eburnea CBS 473.64]|uniref:Uncharacterized protein n=1 Tax=Massarina eburnea CBS 473.64 TaxID=1395130 RepID=A0A6A6RGZ3_9PLEO|nr:hypothetical protein P280DRAFT_485372 [Massarina eburnea CBS 473.64]
MCQGPMFSLYGDARTNIGKTNIEVIIDATELTSWDREFIKEKYDNDGGWNTRFCNLTHMLPIPDIRDYFLIMFQPGNPARQMFAERALLYGIKTPSSSALQPISTMNCNSWTRTDWLAGEATDGTITAKNAFGTTREAFGATNLFFDREPYAVTPRVGNSHMLEHTLEVSQATTRDYTHSAPGSQRLTVPGAVPILLPALDIEEAPNAVV